MIAEKFTFTCDQLSSHRQIACCPTHCVTQHGGKDLLCYNLKDLNQEPLALTGHHGEISAMVFGRRDTNVLLCSASADYIIVWNIELCQKRVDDGLIAAGTVIGTLLGDVVYLAFCSSGERVAACTGNRVNILSSQLVCTLSAHLGPLTAAEFCPWDEEILATTSEDRSFKVWDLKAEAVCYQSFVLSAVCIGTETLNQRKSMGIVWVGACLGACVCDGKQILCGLGDGSVFSYKSNLTGNPAVYTGHNSAVSSVDWSHCRQRWLSASRDRTLRVWPSGSSEPAITLGGDMLSHPISAAQFYYLDKFLLLACGDSLLLYLYHVDNTHDDIKRYKQRSVIKLAARFRTTTATDITALSAINDFYSHLVLQSGADRSLQVMDMNQGRVASEWPDAHSRAIHCIAQNKGSAFATQSPDSHNLFLTSAVTDGIRLWDLRTHRCVRRYENHFNRCHACDSAMSPCGRFIASGSEDNCAYIYDLRSNRFLHKLHRDSDTVLRVAFNPATPEPFEALNGKCEAFTLTHTQIFIAIEQFS
uniref:WD repeat-containing protein 27 n=1 Tax=Gadus morhua TaxID=8049 RepID=A0A8C4Z0U5_GADMO